MKRKKIAHYIKPWLFSLIIHLVFLGTIVIFTASNGVISTTPSYLYPTQVEVRSAHEKISEIKFLPDTSFHNERINPDREITREDKFEIEPFIPSEFIVNPSPKHIPDTISIPLPSDTSYKDMKKWASKIKPSPDPTSLPNVINPAKPVPDSVQNKLPEYPSQARAEGQEGLVILSVEILQDGTVGKIEVVSSSGYPLLDEAAIKSVYTWKFTPATINGQPTTSTIKIPIRFQLT